MKVMKKFKMKPIKLGTIRDYDTPIKPKSNVVWDFDKTLAIFIRDGLRKLAGVWKDTVGIIQSMNHGKQMITINVDLFGRETPVEISFTDIRKL